MVNSYVVVSGKDGGKVNKSGSSRVISRSEDLAGHSFRSVHDATFDEMNECCSQFDDGAAGPIEEDSQSGDDNDSDIYNHCFNLLTLISLYLPIAIDKDCFMAGSTNELSHETIDRTKMPISSPSLLQYSNQSFESTSYNPIFSGIRSSSIICHFYLQGGFSSPV